MSRPRVLFLHAFPLDGRMWGAVAAEVAAAGHEVAVPDLPPPGAPPRLGDWADRLLAAEPGRLVPVGSSLGGYVAFELCRRAPERIAGLALVGTRAGAESPAGRAGRDETIALLRAEGAAALWERLRPRLFGPGAPPELVEAARAAALERDPEALAETVAAIRDREDSTALLGELEAPALVVAGTEDAIVPPREAEAMAAALPAARLVLLEGAGHLVPLERPEALVRELRALLVGVA